MPGVYSSARTPRSSTVARAGSEGRDVELDIDARTGQILEVEYDD